MSTLCSIPWTGFSNEPDGRVQPCCLYKGYITDEAGDPMYIQTSTTKEILHSEFMRNLRQQFRDGEKPAGCSTCWTDESNNYDSKRMIYNTKIPRSFEIDWEAEPDDVRELQLIISNSCNLKCRSCTPSHSTQWQNEMRTRTGSTNYPMPHKQSADEFGKLWTERHEWYKTLTRLEVVGGEPFYVKQWHTMIDELTSLGYSKNIDITMTTNCTLFFPDLIDRMADNFKSVSIGLSIDGIGSTFEYLRHLGKWNVVYENMKKYHALTKPINIQVNITISWLNALQITELHQLIRTEFPKFAIWNNIVHSPVHMALWAAPHELKQEVRNLWEEYSWDEKDEHTMQGILQYMDSKDITENEFSKNLNILYETDAHRKEKLAESIPILNKFIVLVSKDKENAGI